MTALLVVAASASADTDGRRVRLGSVGIHGSYIAGSGYWGPGYWGPGYLGQGYWGSPFYGFGGPLLWNPFLYSGWAHPGFWSSFAQGPGMGEVRLSKAPKESMVYVDGAFAGSVSKLKSMWLEPGAYNLEVRDGDKTWQKRVYVLSGKTLQLQPELTR